jgi:hypothetical protein
MRCLELHGVSLEFNGLSIALEQKFGQPVALV